MGLEGNLAGFPTGSANGVEHFARGAAIVLTRRTARFAPLGLVRKAFFLVEILFACGENEFLTAFLTYQRFVLVSQVKYLFDLKILPERIPPGTVHTIQDAQGFVKLFLPGSRNIFANP